MKIETFNQNLQKKNGPEASAYVPTKYATDSRKCKVAVVYTTGGKVYEYAGTILQVAERLDLIPAQPCTTEDAERIVSELLSGVSVTTGRVGSSDTVKAYIEERGGNWWGVQKENERQDEYGRCLCDYTYDPDAKARW